MYLRNVLAASLSGIVCLGASISAASAQGYNWTQFSAYAGIGGAILDGDVSVNDTTTRSLELGCREPDPWQPKDLHISCLNWVLGDHSVVNRIASALNGDPGVFGTVGIGGDIEATPGVVLGAFADIDFSDADASFSGSSTTNISSIYIPYVLSFNKSSTTNISGSMDHEYSYTFGGRIGVLSLNRQALFYILGGYTRLEMDGATAVVQNNLNVDLSIFGYEVFDKTIAGQPITVNLPGSFDGFTFGVGTQVKLAQGWSIKLEGRYTDLESKSVRYSATKTRDHTLAILKGTGTMYGNGCRYGSSCEQFLRKTASSSGVINIDPDLWSGRVVLSLDF